MQGQCLHGESLVSVQMLSADQTLKMQEPNKSWPKFSHEARKLHVHLM